jgi:hypothetical protein
MSPNKKDLRMILLHKFKLDHVNVAWEGNTVAESLDIGSKSFIAEKLNDRSGEEDLKSSMTTFYGLR